MLRVGRVRPRDLSELGRRSVGGKELRAHPRVRTLRVLPEPEIWHIPKYSHNYAQFYQLLDRNLFTHRNTYVILRETTSEIYGPQVSSLSYFPSRSIFICFCFQIYYSKNPKIPCFFFIYFILFYREIYLSKIIQTNLCFARGGIDNPSYASGYKYWFFVCRYHLHSVAWFSYWIDTLVSQLREIPTVAVLHHPFLFGEIPT